VPCQRPLRCLSSWAHDRTRAPGLRALGEHLEVVGSAAPVPEHPALDSLTGPGLVALARVVQLQLDTRTSAWRCGTRRSLQSLPRPRLGRRGHPRERRPAGRRGRPGRRAPRNRSRVMVVVRMVVKTGRATIHVPTARARVAIKSDGVRTGAPCPCRSSGVGDFVRPL